MWVKIAGVWEDVGPTGDLSAYQALSDHDTFVGALAYKTTAQSVANNTHTAVSLDAEDLDTDTFHDNATNNSRLTIPSGKAGKYRITAQVNFAAHASGFRLVALRVNNSVRNEVRASPGSGATSESVSISFIRDLAAGDYVEVFAYQDSGASLNVQGNDAIIRATYLAVEFLGA